MSKTDKEKELLEQRIQVLKLKIKELEQKNDCLQQTVNQYFKLLERER